MIVSTDGFKFEELKCAWEPWLIHEPRVLSALKDLVIGNGLWQDFVDVGAYIGDMTIRLAGLFSRVYAFEPVPDNADVLDRNIALNASQNVTVVRCAVGEMARRATVFCDQSFSGQFRRDTDKIVEVDVVTLDSIELAPWAVVKVDVEGFEESVIRGAARLLTWKAAFVIEHHTYKGFALPDSLKNICALFPANYAHVRIDGSHYAHVPKDCPGIDRILVHGAANLIEQNFLTKRDRFFGLPGSWWWGMTAMDYLAALRLSGYAHRDELLFALGKPVTESQRGEKR